MRPRLLASVVLTLASIAAAIRVEAKDPAGIAAPRDVSALLAPLRAKHDVPGMAGAIVCDGRVTALGADGVREKGQVAKVTVDDRWHLGSCTKSMTATLVAMLVEEKKLAWDTTVGDVFAKTVKDIDAAWKPVTLDLLLHNRSGAPGSLDADGLWGRLWQFKGTPREARMELVKGVVKRPPEAPPGTKFIYSNAGFSIAGAMAETVMDTPWEKLIAERLWKPLGITTGGFGAPGTKFRIDEPRGHRADGSPIEPGPGSDNPVAIGPAGIAHMTIGDWAKYVALHVQGEGKDARLLKSEAFARLHAPLEGDDAHYAMGWIVADRPWGGRVLTHNGSNTMWYCVTWWSPSKDFGVLVTCTRGGDEAAMACDEAAGALIQDHLAHEGGGK